jgi:hypothetical protein
MQIFNATAKTILLLAIISMLAMPAVAGDKLQTGAAKGDAKKHKKSYKTPCTENCEDNSTRNLKNR